MSKNLQAAAIMALGMTLISCNDAITKYMSQSLGIGQLLFFRGLVAMIILITIIKLIGQPVFTPLFFDRWNLIRGGCEVSTTLAFVTALSLLPLAVATTLIFTFPILLTFLAAMVLRETVGIQRWGAVLVGFIGVLFITRPGSQSWSWVFLLPLGAAFMSALRDLATRHINANLPSLHIALMTFSMVTIVGLAASPFGWQDNDTVDFAWMALSASLLCGGFLCYIAAIRLGELSFVAPFNYTSIVVAMVLGFVIWRDVPNAGTLVGASLIVVSGIFILYREQRAARDLLRPALQPDPTAE